MNTIFITGGAQGIGRATVKKFIAEGWNVTFTDINTEAAKELQDELATDNLLFVPGDTRSKEDLRKAVEATVARFGNISSVFTNAGIHRTNTILDISDEELHTIMDINVFGTVNTLQAVLPEIIRNGGGSVVLNCSDQWFIGKPHSFAYGMTKGAIGQIARSLSIDLAQYNIRVNAVCPGSIRTGLLDGALDSFSKIFDTTFDNMVNNENALYARGEMGRPSEVANLVFFLASDQASFCTGSHYMIDGGLIAK